MLAVINTKLPSFFLPSKFHYTHHLTFSWYRKTSAPVVTLSRVYHNSRTWFVVMKTSQASIPGWFNFTNVSIIFKKKTEFLVFIRTQLSKTSLTGFLLRVALLQVCKAGIKCISLLLKTDKLLIINNRNNSYKKSIDNP